MNDYSTQTNIVPVGEVMHGGGESCRVAADAMHDGGATMSHDEEIKNNGVPYATFCAYR